MNEKPPTSREAIDTLAAVAKKRLKFVYKGNY
jgi:hypothetical protein